MTSPRPKASITMPVSTEPAPSPPYSSAIGSASQPSSANCFQIAGTEAERIARAAAAVIGVIGFRDEAVDTFAQQPLLVAEVEVHLIYFTAAVFLTEGCSPAGSTTMPNSCRLCA